MKKLRYVCHNDSELLNCWLAVAGFSIAFAFKESSYLDEELELEDKRQKTSPSRLSENRCLALSVALYFLFTVCRYNRLFTSVAPQAK